MTIPRWVADPNGLARYRKSNRGLPPPSGSYRSHRLPEEEVAELVQDDYAPFLEDGIHPSHAGYTAMARVVRQAGVFGQREP